MRAREDGQKLTSLLPAAAAAVTGRLPLAVAETVGVGAGVLFWTLSKRYRRQTLENLRHSFPERPDSSRAALARHALTHAGREVGATMRWFVRGREGLPGVCSNYADLAATIERDRAAGRGAIYAGAHLGNPQLLSALCATVAPVTGVGISYHTRPHLRFVAEGRRRLGLHYVPDSTPPLDVLRALQRNELVTFLPDMQPHRNAGLWLPFLGRPACTTTFPASLARLTGAVLRPIFLVRDGRRYRAVIRDPIATPRLAANDADLERAMREWSAVVEEEVRRRPEQWIWMSRRWRPVPEGARILAAGAAGTPPGPAA